MSKKIKYNTGFILSIIFFFVMVFIAIAYSIQYESTYDGTLDYIDVKIQSCTTDNITILFNNSANYSISVYYENEGIGRNLYVNNTTMNYNSVATKHSICMNANPSLLRLELIDVLHEKHIIDKCQYPKLTKSKTLRFNF
jgi:hypothetical protein